MAFVQIIEFRSSKIDQMEAIGNEYLQATEGKRKVRRRYLAEDRDNPGRYFNIVFFDSYEDAMANSAMPETDAMSKKMAAVVDGPPTFYNLNVLDSREF